MRKRKIDYGLLLRQSLERDRQRAEAQNDLERQEEKRNQLKLWKKFIQTQKGRRKEMKKKKPMYMVMLLKTEVDIEESLTHTVTSIPLVTAKGMLGMIPVFKTLKDAKEYCQDRAPILAVEYQDK